MNNHSSEQSFSFVEYTSSVLEKTKYSIERLETDFPQNFSSVLSILRATKGRVITTGIGKSGLVARKFSSSLSSVGCPAFFIHPIEAGHGELGALQREDTLVIFSNSGESLELLPFLQQAQKLSVKILSITSNPHSLLGRASQSLCYPKVDEYCPIGMVPTLSIIMMLLLGDLIVGCLTIDKGLTKKEYHNWHPQGFLGRQFLKVQSEMRCDALPIVSQEASIEDMLYKMAETGYDFVGIVDQKDCLLAEVDLSTLKRVRKKELAFEQAMNTKPFVLSAETNLETGFALLAKAKRKACFVQRKSGHIEGVFIEKESALHGASQETYGQQR